MPRHQIKPILATGLIVVCLMCCLYSGFAQSSMQARWLAAVFGETHAACRDAGTQWMVVVCLLSYFIVFVVLEAKAKAQSPKSKVEDQKTERSTPNVQHPTSKGAVSLSSPRPRAISYLLTSISSPDFWLIAFVALGLLRYAFDYSNAARSLQVVVMLTGIVIGKGIGLWARASRSFKVQDSRFKLKEAEVGRDSPLPAEFTNDTNGAHGVTRPTLICSILLFLLAVASLWHPERGMEFQYRGQPRWTGPWDNPNLFGLMMGVGLVLAVGQLVSSFKLQVSRSSGVSRLNSIWFALFLIGAAGLCAYGLLKSYSRGAWLGTAVGIGYLIWKWINREPRETLTREKLSTFNFQPSTHHAESRTTHHAPRRIWLPASILLFSILVISFWQFRHTESPMARRVFSVGNPNDFSWRNRVTAWQGAWQMIVDKPLAGFGWGKAEEIYSKEYRAARLEESAAVQLNDYLMIGISAGTPALGCLLVYLYLVVGRGVGKLSTFNLQLSTAAKAGVAVLLLGFWFDGGLFKLPTCVVFWVLLEMTRRADIPVCQFGRLSSRPVLEHLERKHGTGMSREPAGWKTCPTILLRWLAGIFATIALGLTALHLGPPQLAVSERTLSLARKFLVPPQEKADFEYLAAEKIWSGIPLKTLLQHAHLANYNRSLVNWKLDDQLYREFVLSPEIFPAPGLTATLSPSDGERAGVRGWDDMNWRRPLWEYFYPRIRKESSLAAAAEIVVRHLSETCRRRGDETNTAATTNSTPHVVAYKTILEIWQRQTASDDEFERIYVAALRSAGIPARLATPSQVEFWNGAEWKPAPRPPESTRAR